MSETPESYLTRNGIKFRRQAPDKHGHVNLEFKCPVCDRDRKAQINNHNWLWQCHSGKCDGKGNEFTLKRLHGNVYTIKDKGESLEDIRSKQFAEAMKQKISAASDVERWHLDLMHSGSAEHAREYLRSRGITDEVISLAKLGWSERFPSAKQSVAPKKFGVTKRSEGWLMIPVFADASQADDAAMVKCRNLKEGCDKGDRYRRVAGGKSLLYAPCGIDPDKTLILTSGEIDCLSIVVAGWENVAATTLGEGNWDDLWSTQLEGCSDIVIIYDNDDGGREGARKVAHLLGLHRCRIGTWPDKHKDANACLQAQGNDFDVFTVQIIVNQSKPITVDGIVSLSSLRERYLATFNSSAGRRGWSTGWDDLDDLIGGWRPSEITMVTGDTGCGKTTFTSQAALNMAASGHGVLYCPFEMGLIDQQDKWVRQLGEADPEELLELGRIGGVLDHLEGLPLWAFWRPGKIKPEAMRNTLLYAARRLQVRFVVVDHIHWMIEAGSDERTQLDALSNMFCEVTALAGFHLIVVAHPRSLGTSAKDTKHRDNVIVQMDDIKGTSALKQNAHNILSVWRPRSAERKDVVDKGGFGKAVAYLLKCRKEYGSEGKVAFRYWTAASKMLPYEMQLDIKPKSKQVHTWHDDM